MRILYISTLASLEAIEDARAKNPSFCPYAVQKFNRLVTQGLCRNGHEVTALSTFYVPDNGLFFFRRKEEDHGVVIKYTPSVNWRPLRTIWLMLYCFFVVFFWGVSNSKEKVIICDVLNISASSAALFVARILRMRCVGVMTDMPGLGIGEHNSRMADKGRGEMKFSDCMSRRNLSRFSHYVFLTKQMNEVVNINGKPFIVMEGLVDADSQECEMRGKEKPRVVIYAGGLFERYGLRLLVEGFLQANVENTVLWLYGKGPFSEEISNYNDARLVYKGIRPNAEVLIAEKKATLLVNPRPTGEEFAQYSFPSKNMEYMLSGTPLLTTPLPGMPKEYYPYVYLFDKGESIDGYAETLRAVLTKPEAELVEQGERAKEWVLENKNHIRQTARIVELFTNQ